MNYLFPVEELELTCVARLAVMTGGSCPLSCDDSFENDVATTQETLDHTRHKSLAVQDMVCNLGKRHVGRSLDQREDLCSIALNPS
ncbi:hypothetical protein [Bradyrhizobium lupini]|uniref:hypothetical protein n=1 Tax=Rhizobium lupini TaxID=136996 RepID=UPI0034C64B0E